MIVYRLSKAKYANDLSGKGAEIAGGRWNSKGVSMIYTSESRALATTEIAVHTSLGNIPIDYCIISLEIPDAAIKTVEMTDLPLDWSEVPPKLSSQKFGDKFVFENNSLVLKVPSAVVEGDFNYLINPKNKDIGLIRIVKVSPFTFDRRLFT
ncbi:MAG: RES family NAD+ phosphorylase [Paludibacter sp.]